MQAERDGRCEVTGSAFKRETGGWPSQQAWAAANGLCESRARECPRVVAGKRCVRYNGQRFSRPRCICEVAALTDLFDHTRMWIDGNGGHVLTTEPYFCPPERVAAVAVELAPLGLTVETRDYSPWNPGSTTLLVISSAEPTKASQPRVVVQRESVKDTEQAVHGLLTGKFSGKRRSATRRWDIPVSGGSLEVSVWLNPRHAGVSTWRNADSYCLSSDGMRPADVDAMEWLRPLVLRYANPKRGTYSAGGSSSSVHWIERVHLVEMLEIWIAQEIEWGIKSDYEFGSGEPE